GSNPAPPTKIKPPASQWLAGVLFCVPMHRRTSAGCQKWVLQAISHGIEAVTIARLYRKHWRIQGMFPRLESVLQSEIKCLGHPRAALLGFVAAVMA
ncbi:MAG: hypothetical protein Q7J66_03980, partial [Hydrogenophaga sp.]|nr:hypothetical protein [Hydrogenophaga sp.]